jgi:hypothetical protein
MRIAWITLAVAFAAPIPVASASDTEDEAARNDATPLPTRSDLRLEPDYTWLSGGGYIVETKIRATLRYRGFFVPNAEVPGFVSFVRFQTYARSTNDRAKDEHASGLTDTLVLDGVGHTFSPELAVGIGYATILPTATASALDHQQWLLGPAFLLDTNPLRSLQIAFLVYDVWTIAKQDGASSYAYASVQPILTWHFEHGVFIGSDATMTFDWTGNGRTDIPIDFGIGKAFGESFVGGVQGWYTVAGANQGNASVHVKLTFPLGTDSKKKE